LSNARLGEEVRSEKRFQPFGDARRVGANGCGQFGKPIQSSSRSAKSACDIEQIVRSRAGAEQGASARHGSNQDDVGHGNGGFGQVAAGQWSLPRHCQGQQPVEEALYPGSPARASHGQLSRHSQRKKGGHGTSAHGRQVAQAAGQCAMAHGLRLVPVQAEVAPGYRQIRRHSRLFTPARSQKGAIVADAQSNTSAGGATCPCANLVEEGKLARLARNSGIDIIYPHLLRIG
jgi:hypothetical protein